MYIYDDTEFTGADIGRKFSNTYVRLKEYGIVMIGEVREDGFMIHFSNGKTDYLSPLKFVIEQDFPEMGIMINYKNRANKVLRVPRRQWLAGFTQTVIQFETGHPANRQLADNMTWGLVKAIFDPEYPDANFAYHKVKSEERSSLAFTKDYWFFNDRESIKLYHGKICLGSVKLDDKTFKLTLNTHALSFEQELKDYFKENNFVIERDIRG
jgi:hypothetical protein